VKIVNKVYAQTNASPKADAIAEVNKNTAMTMDLIFVGALVNAYSRPVMEAKISLSAIST
jgi:hypothetical protein